MEVKDTYRKEYQIRMPVEGRKSFVVTLPLLTLDGDGQHDADDIPKVVKPVMEGRIQISCATVIDMV
jgi:hypothetical protein